MSIIEDIDLENTRMEFPSSSSRSNKTTVGNNNDEECSTCSSTSSNRLKRSKRVADLVSLEDSCVSSIDQEKEEEEEVSCGRERNRSGDIGAFGNFTKLRRILDTELEYFHREVDIAVASTRVCYQGNYEVFKSY